MKTHDHTMTGAKGKAEESAASIREAEGLQKRRQNKNHLLISLRYSFPKMMQFPRKSAGLRAYYNLLPRPSGGY